MIPLVSRKRLEILEVGETIILREPDGTNAGAAAQCYALRARIKIETHVCFIVVPKNESMTKVISITRTA